MCGECIEEDFFRNYFLPIYIDYEEDSLYMHWHPPFHFINTNNILSTIKLYQENNIKYDGVDIAFCRMIDEFITRGFKYDFLKDIEHLFPLGELNYFFKKSKNSQKNNILIRLYDRNTLNNKDGWNNFISRHDDLHSKSYDILSEYHKRYLAKEEERELYKSSGSYYSGEKNASMITSEFSSATYREWFDKSFPLIYFSLCYLYKNSKKSVKILELIKRIALDAPSNFDNFIGRDLWLQRKAYEFCVKEYGVDFIIRNYSEVRRMLNYYSLLNVNIPGIELYRLKCELHDDSYMIDVIDAVMSNKDEVIKPSTLI